MIHTLIIGAGPFGLTLAAHLRHLGIDHLIVGKTMEFWEKNMPEGMYLRSGCDWHLDVNNVYTIEAFLQHLGLTAQEVEPISLQFYLRYANWFIDHTKPAIKDNYVNDLQRTPTGYLAFLDDNTVIEAKHVVVAVGFRYFAYVPPNIVSLLPPGRYSHTCDTVQLQEFRDKRVLIIGGRQSAFEWTALLRESGAKKVHVSYRHDTPGFITADWDWVTNIINNIAEYPTWFRELNEEGKDQYRYRLWAEGRLKVEPWLDQRVHHDNIILHPLTQVVKTGLTADNTVDVILSNGESFEVDHIITATGYKVDITKLPFINSSLLDTIECSNGYANLDPHFQSNVPGLFFTSFMAGQDFGPFFGFTIGVRTAARLVGKALEMQIDN